VSTKGERTRLRIVAAGLRLLREQGAQVSMEQVATAAGITRQALYLHYRTRTELVLAVLDQLDKDLGAATLFRAAFAQTDPQRLVETVIRAAVTFHGQVADVAQALIVARYNDPAAAAAWNTRSAAQLKGVLRLMERLKRAGRLLPQWSPKRAAEALSTWVLTPRAYLELVGERGWTEEQLVQASIAAVHGFLKPR
jgi:AcrR family transcriptional regulator